jgi:hypothetical protein
MLMDSVGGPELHIDQSRVGELSARDAHDEAEVGKQAVVGAEYRGAQRVPAAGAMAALEARDRGALQPAIGTGQGAQ